jgi:hypothetical protein
MNAKLVPVDSHVVSHVRKGRWVDGAEPENVYPKILEIVKLGGDTVEVADAVSVGVIERARVNLVHDRRLPPGLICNGGHGGLERVGILPLGRLGSIVIGIKSNS